jgi:hypothetical protein
VVMSNSQLLAKAAGPIGTGDFIANVGTLSAEQSTAFLDQVYEATPFSALIRTERRRAKTGSIAKIGIGGRLLRKKTAGVDDATLIKPTFGEVDYTTVRARVDWETEEEVFEENIEGGGLEDHLMRLVTGQVGRDLEDLHFNADTADTSVDAPFLTLNDGWLKQLAAGGSTAHRVNGGAVNGGVIIKDHFFDALNAMPNKYKQQGSLRWIGSPLLFERYAEYLTSRATPAGDAVLINGSLTQILGTDIVRVPAMPNTRLILATPSNFIAVNTRDIRFRRTTEGREAIRADKRFYAIFLDDDPIIEEQDGIVDLYGLAA